uniref:Putative Chaperone DnaJ-domain superfamily protein n=1 Tax=Davidia involucrata TaxID=16924 RepID=A0A5B7B8I5_DAVIN
MASASLSLSTPFFSQKFAVDAPPSPPTCVRFRSSNRVSAVCTSTAERARVHIASPASLYEVLGIQMGATCQEIKVAYRRLARVLHPDVASNGQKDTSADEFMKIHAAYATLSDPEKRADYDSTLFRRRRQLSSQFSMSPSSSTAVMSSSFSGYTRQKWETDQCW